MRFLSEDSDGFKMFCTTVHMKCSDALHFIHLRQDQKLEDAKTIPFLRKGHLRSNPKIARQSKEEHHIASNTIPLSQTNFQAFVCTFGGAFLMLSTCWQSFMLQD